MCHVALRHAQTTKTTTNKTETIQDYFGGSRVQKSTCSGIITPVRVNELIPRECFCMLYAQWVNLFGMRVVLCLLPAPCAVGNNNWSERLACAVTELSVHY